MGFDQSDRLADIVFAKLFVNLVRFKQAIVQHKISTAENYQ